MSTPAATAVRSPGRRWLRVAWRATWMAALGVALTLASAWATAALYYDVRVEWLRVPLTAAYALTVLAAWVFVRRRSWSIAITIGAFFVVVVWWLNLKPSNDRAWQPDVAVLAYADIDGDRVTVHNIRNCDYRSESDFDVRHYDKQYDLSRLRTAELYMVYWGSPYMAHTMVSFGFDDGAYLCFSIETRKELGEGYSAVKGLFRQFELIYVAADERDVVRLRTNYRVGEDAYLFRLNGSPGQLREFFLDYVQRMNSLRSRPEWYSALMHNCTTSIRMQRAADDRAAWDWRMLANGFGDELLYERGMIATTRPLPELKERAHVNARARSADSSPDFSRLIRAGIYDE